MKLCDRCRVSSCCLNYLGTACANARSQVCPDVQANNAELIHNMTLDELAAFLAAWAQGAKAWKREFGEVRGWLTDEPTKQETAENYDTDLAVFPAADCWPTREAAHAALAAEKGD